MPVLIERTLGDGYESVDVVKSGNAVYKNGKLMYIIIDVNKPGKYFYDLTGAFNASVGEANKSLALKFKRGGANFDTNHYSIAINGLYPDGKTDFHVVGAVLDTNNAIVNFNFPLGLFQVVGIYSFQFEITNTADGTKETSHWCFFNVTQNANQLAVGWNGDVTPYDSQIEQRLQRTNQQLDNIDEQIAANSKQIQTTADLSKQISNNVNDIINGALSDVPKLDQNNTFKGINNFGNVNASAITVTNGNLTNLSATSLSADTLALNKSLMLNGEDITKGLIKQTASLHGTPINGITWFYANIFKFSLSEGVFAICAMEFNIPNNSTMQKASESNPVPIFQFTKGSLDGLGGTVFSSGTALLKLDTANDTLDFCGLTNNDWDSWGKAVRDYKPIFSTYD